jgi:hypothetical protein
MVAAEPDGGWRRQVENVSSADSMHVKRLNMGILLGQVFAVRIAQQADGIFPLIRIEKILVAADAPA